MLHSMWELPAACHLCWCMQTALNMTDFEPADFERGLLNPQARSASLTLCPVAWSTSHTSTSTLDWSMCHMEPLLATSQLELYSRVTITLQSYSTLQLAAHMACQMACVIGYKSSTCPCSDLLAEVFSKFIMEDVEVANQELGLWSA